MMVRGSRNKATGGHVSRLVIVLLAIGCAPPSRSDLVVLAREHASLGRLDRAAAAYRRIIRTEQDDAETWNRLALVLLRSGEYEGAVHAFQETLRRRPDDRHARSALAGALERARRFREAVEVYRELVRQGSDWEPLAGKLATALVRKAEAEAAAAACGEPEPLEDLAPVPESLAETFAAIDGLLAREDNEIDVARASLVMSRAVYAETDIDACLRQVDAMAEELATETAALPSGERKVAAIHRYLTETRGFGYTGVRAPDRRDPSDFQFMGQQRWLGQLLESGRGNCNASTTLYVALGQRLGLPLRGALAPWHVFVRHAGTDEQFFFETTSGQIPSDSVVIREFNTEPNDYYLRSLTNREFVASQLSHHLGMDFGGRGMYAEQLACCEKALVLFPAFAGAWVNRGSALRALGRLEDAIASHERGAALNPLDPVAWFNKGNALDELGRYDEALECYDRALAINPRYRNCLANRSMALRKMGMSKEARVAIDRVSRMSRSPQRSALVKARAILSSGRCEDAVAAFNEMLKDAPENLEALIGKATALANLGRHEEALPLYEQTLRLEPGLPLVWSNMANSLRELERFEEAMAGYDRAIELSPRYANAMGNKALALVRQGRLKRALEVVDRALEIDPGLSPYWRLKAAVHLRLGEDEAARRCAEELEQISGPLPADFWDTLREVAESMPSEPSGQE